MDENNGDPVVNSPSVHDLIVAHQEDGRPRFEKLRAAFVENQGKMHEEYYALEFPAALLLVSNSRGRWFPGSVYKTRLFYNPELQHYRVR